MRFLFFLLFLCVIASHGFHFFSVPRRVKAATSITCSLSTPNEQRSAKKSNKKRRVDELLIERQQAVNKDEVEKMIMSGNVILNDSGEIITSSAL